MKFLLRNIICVGTLAFVALGGAKFTHASQPANTWKTFDMTMSYSGDGLTKKRRATIDSGEVIHTTSQTTSGLMFTCLAGYFMVAASMDPQDFRELYKQSTTRSKLRHIDMSIDGGEKIPLGLWFYKPKLRTVSSRKRFQAAKLYNAVVRRQNVTLYLSGKKPVVLNLPSPNSIFANFGAGCGIGKLAKKK